MLLLDKDDPIFMRTSIVRTLGNLLTFHALPIDSLSFPHYFRPLVTRSGLTTLMIPVPISNILKYK